MTRTLDLTPELEARLQERAARHGKDPGIFLRQFVEEHLAADESDPAYLLTLPIDERRRIMAAQFDNAAPLYEADLAMPVERRELTAFCLEFTP